MGSQKCATRLSDYLALRDAKVGVKPEGAGEVVCPEVDSCDLKGQRVGQHDGIVKTCRTFLQKEQDLRASRIVVYSGFPSRRL